MSALIDLRDHYSYFDPSVSVYRFLKYSDRAWRLWNPPLHYQNRMRASEFRELFAGEGWEIVKFDAEEPDERDKAELERMHLAPHFRSLGDNADLGVKSLWVVVRSPENGNDA